MTERDEDHGKDKNAAHNDKANMTIEDEYYKDGSEDREGEGEGGMRWRGGMITKRKMKKVNKG